MCASGFKISALTRFLMLEGNSYDRAKEGLAPYVAQWEESVAYIEQASIDDIGASEEYDYDLWARTVLFRALQHATQSEVGSVADRIVRADQRFMDATTPYCGATPHIDNPDRGLHWWLFRTLKK